MFNSFVCISAVFKNPYTNTKIIFMYLYRDFVSVYGLVEKRLWSASKIGAVTSLCFGFFWGRGGAVVIFSPFLQTSEIRDTCIPGYWNQSKFPVHKVWWLREASQIGQTFIPRCEKLFKTQHGRIIIDPVIFAAIGHRFIK